ncbi:MAG: hypothetical protein HYV02_01225 [Deltaproteobacteria bacterium]|nr:hypothetical protein [Deltaproteobacteria bacterium]
MDKKPLHGYAARWDAVAKREALLLQQTSLKTRFQQLLSIFKLGRELGLGGKDDDDTQSVRLRWALLKREKSCG